MSYNRDLSSSKFIFDLSRVNRSTGFRVHAFEGSEIDLYYKLIGGQMVIFRIDFNAKTGEDKCYTAL